MKSLQFALDLPYIENKENIEFIINRRGCDRNEAIQIDYQMNWKEKRREFALQTRCITAFFERLFSHNINNTNCQKILVECVPQVSEKFVVNFTGINTVQVECDYNLFLRQDNLNKKKLTLELLMTGIKQIASLKKWDMEPFELTYAKILDAKYKNEWVWKRFARSPDRSAVANVLLQHEVTEIDIYIVVSDNNGVETFRERIISELPDEYAYSGHLGEIKWTSNRKIILINKNKDKEWLVSI